MHCSSPHHVSICHFCYQGYSVGECSPNEHPHLLYYTRSIAPAHPPHGTHFPEKLPLPTCSSLANLATISSNFPRLLCILYQQHVINHCLSLIHGEARCDLCQNRLETLNHTPHFGKVKNHTVIQRSKRPTTTAKLFRLTGLCHENYSFHSLIKSNQNVFVPRFAKQHV